MIRIVGTGLLLLSVSVCAGQSTLTTPEPAIPAGSAVSPLPEVQMPQAMKFMAPAPVAGLPTQGNPLAAAQEQPSRPSGPVTVRTDFEQFAEGSAGENLPVYGRELFQNVPSTFAPVDLGPVPADYVIGPQDEILIRVWGAIDIDSRVTVDRNGQIFLPRVGMLNVAGLRYEQLQGFLHSGIAQLYKDFELSVSLGQLRTIQVYVVGNVRQPGVYTVSAFSTLVDALFVSGGPSATGTMRNIELRRAGKRVTTFDIYALLQKGDESSDTRLLPGDVIYIPPAGPQVAVAGEVNTPGIYELKGGTTVQSALRYAGGLTPLAATDRVVVESIRNHSRRVSEEFALDSAGMKRTLANGDVLRVFPLSPRFQNVVTLKGNVARPGRYTWREGMRVADLIPSRDALISRNYWNRENHLVQEGAHGEFAAPSGQIGRMIAGEPGGPDSSAPSGQPAVDPASANGRGRGLTPNGNASASWPETRRSDSPESKTVASIAGNDAEINWDYAVIERLNPQNLSTQLIPFRLGNAIDNPASADDRELLQGDVVTVFSRKDLPLPVEKEAMYVRVSGEVGAPGVYRVKPGDTLRDVVIRAGGLAPSAYLYAAQLTRVSTRRAQEEQLQASVEEMQREAMGRYAQIPATATEKPADLQAQMQMQQATIGRIAAIRPTGRVVLEMKPNAHTVQDIPNFRLEDGDSFYIPTRPGTVQVVGAVYNQSAFRYVPAKDLGNYLADAGGATRDADVKRAFLIRADGTVVNRSRHSSLWVGDFNRIAIYPGDAIVVPAKIRGAGGLAEFAGVTQILSQTALAAAALSVIQQ
jgi:polysaccharide export outer membrane protein